jgi:hypothetical protein
MELELPYAFVWNRWEIAKKLGERGKELGRLPRPGIISESRIDRESIDAVGDVDPAYVGGYWQNVDVVSEYSEIDQEFLRRRFKVNPNYRRYLDVISESETVSVHLRFGDFFSSETNANEYGVVDYEKVGKIVDELSSNGEFGRVLLFSDDLVRARKFIGGRNVIPVVPIFGCSCPISEMALMIGCKHNVITNSTFGWWGAYLNPHPEKMVYCPLVWKNGSDFSLCLPTWIGY